MTEDQHQAIAVDVVANMIASGGSLFILPARRC